MAQAAEEVVEVVLAVLAATCTNRITAMRPARVNQEQVGLKW